MLSLCMQCENVACRAVNWQCCVLGWSKDICKRITTFHRCLCFISFVFLFISRSPSVLKTRVKKLRIAGKHGFCFGGDSRERLFPAPALQPQVKLRMCGVKKRKHSSVCTRCTRCIMHSAFHSILKSRVKKLPGFLSHTVIPLSSQEAYSR